MSGIDDAREQGIKQLTLQDSNDFDNPLPNNVAKTPVVITKNGEDIRDMLLDEGKVDGHSITIEGGKLAVKLDEGSPLGYGDAGIFVQPARLHDDLPDDATTTVTPDQFNKLNHVVANLISALKTSGLLVLIY